MMLKKSLIGTVVLSALAFYVAAPEKIAVSGTIPQSAKSYIVQGSSIKQAKRFVIEAGGTVDRALAIIHGVEASLTESSIAILAKTHPGLRITENSAVISVAKKKDKNKDKSNDNDAESDDASSSQSTPAGGAASSSSQGDAGFAHAPSLVRANELHQFGIDGRGITVAFIDSGLWEKPGLKKATTGEFRIEQRHDAMSGKSGKKLKDDSGHGTHVASIIASSYQTAEGFWEGVAPSANLVAVKAFDKDGQGTYADVISAIDWLVEVKDEHNIRVLNLSISAPARSTTGKIHSIRL